jgi:surface polysaccharide O-acyltransferase-like enzyme
MRPAKTARRNDIDALRVLAFGLLILYHVGMFYVSWDWHVKSRYEFDWLEPAMSMVNQWRMPLIFMISGLAVNFLLGEGDRRRLGYRSFAWQRIVRLGVPLLFGMLVIVPPQAYFEALENGAIEPGYLAFLWRYFTFQAWPEGAFAGSDYGLTWNHLWYLPYLLTYSLLLIPVAAFLNGPGRALRQRLCRLRGVGLWLLPILPLMAWGQWIFPHFPYIRHDLITDGYAHALFGTFYLYGFVIGRDAGLWRELAALRWYTLAVALVTYVLLMAYREVLPDEPGALADTAFMAVIYLNRWTWLLLVLGWGHRLLNREFAWLPYARAAVYPWYVLHQTITVVAGYALTRLALGPVVEPLLVLAATFGGCALLHHFVVRRIGRFGLLFGYTAAVSADSQRAAAIEMAAVEPRSG